MAAALVAVAAVGAKDKDAIVGEWYNDIKSSKLMVYEEGGKYHGKVVWLETTTNEDGSSPRVDEHNPDPELAKRELMGMVILQDLEWDEDDQEWEDGTIYDPKSGKTYSCYCYIQDDGSLYFKGYILGLPFLGRSTTWTRP